MHFSLSIMGRYIRHVPVSLAPPSVGVDIGVLGRGGGRTRFLTSLINPP